MKRTYLWLAVLGIMLAFALPVMAGTYEGTPIKSGQATFKYNGKDLTYKFVEGGFQQMKGFTIATMVFKPKEKLSNTTDDHLNVTVKYQAPGKVDLDSAFSMSGISMFSGGEVSRFTKGKSKGTITLTKASATELEGVADFTVMHDISGKVMPPVKNLKFSARTK
jgi:hypothetical protein